MERRLKDIIPTRRDVLKLGGVALASTWVDRIMSPTKVYASGKATPRGCARFAIVIEMGGAISPMDCWDFKETKYTRRIWMSSKSNRTCGCRASSSRC